MNTLKQTLRRFGYEVVMVDDSKPQQLRLSGRVHLDQQSRWEDLRRYLVVATAPDWAVDVSKHFFSRNGHEVFCWRLIFQSRVADAPIAGMLEQITAYAQATPITRVTHELEEQPLSVIGPRVTMNERGKGAQPAGSLPKILSNRLGGQ